MRMSLLIVTALVLAGCKEKAAESDSHVYISTTPNNATIKSLKYDRGGWFPVPGGPGAITVQVDIDVDRQQFSATAKLVFASGDLLCPTVIYGGANYRKLIDALDSLRPVNPPDAMRIDAGVATLAIRDSNDQEVQWTLDSSDGDLAGVRLLGGASALERQLGDIADACAHPANVDLIDSFSYERGGGFPVPSQPYRVTVNVTLDKPNKSFTYEAKNFYAGDVESSCSGTISVADFDDLAEELSRVRQVPAEPSFLVDGGMRFLTLAQGVRAEEYLLEGSDMGAPPLRVLAGTDALEQRLWTLAQACVSQN